MGRIDHDESSYEAPKLEVIGAVAALTATIDKNFDSTDGLTFMGTPIGNASP